MNNSLHLARKHKRLKFWQTQFNNLDLSPEEKNHITEKLNTYCLLISKIATGIEDKDTAESIKRISSLERELSTFFEKSRLFTSNIGNASIVE
ncbi:MAG: hypothetical protein KBC84_01270 [Proteobacteria bacterium]|nr:hypothetical protein [Pseudomonadota bacterium]